ncbi:MAG: sigma 54-interacting transcriptional regulator [Peptococcaceae bacterium]
MMKNYNFSTSSPEVLTLQGLITILDSTYNGIIVVNKEGIITICNKSAERVLQKSARKILKSHIKEILPNTCIMEVLETGQPQIGQKFIINDRPYITNRTPLVKNGGIIGAVAVFQDMSDLECISRELKTVKELSRELDAIITSSYDGIYVTDGRGNTTKVNKAYERITGVLGSEVIGRNMEELVKAGFYDQSVTLLVLQKRKPDTIMQEIKKTGKHVIVTGNPIFNSEGEIVCVVTNVRDITELNNLKNQLEMTKNLSNRYYSELQHLRSQQMHLEGMIVVSPEMKNIIEKVKRVSQVESTVLIQGESGVGKENIAKLVHRFSPRAEGPFIKINCGAIPENLMESELFGYEGGAFTGAKKGGKPGLVELANGGTFFIDEIGELPLAMQVKLLRLIQEREFIPIGSSGIQRVNVRFVAATNKNLEKMVLEKSFREDLFYRLNVVPIHIPPLRERKSDLLPLINHFVKHFTDLYRLNKKLSPEALAMLMNYSWPGNIRELENTVEQFIVMASGSEITVEDIPASIRDKLPRTLEINKPLESTLAKVEKEIISKALEHHQNMEKTAESLGIHRTTLLRKARKYGICISYDQNV